MSVITFEFHSMTIDKSNPQSSQSDSPREREKERGRERQSLLLAVAVIFTSPVLIRNSTLADIERWFIWNANGIFLCLGSHRQSTVVSLCVCSMLLRMMISLMLILCMIWAALSYSKPASN